MSTAPPTSTDPTGAPNPLEKQTETVSNGAARSAASRLLPTAALNIRAPSRWVASPYRRASAVASATKPSGNIRPPIVFSSASSRVRAKCGSSGLIAASIMPRSIVPSGRFSTGWGWIDPSTAPPPASNL